MSENKDANAAKAQADAAVKVAKIDCKAAADKVPVMKAAASKTKK